LLYDEDDGNNTSNNQQGSVTMNYKIRYASGHVEVFDEQGDFLFSADSAYEAQCELLTMDAA
jgi:hypothetical protein